MAEPGHRMRARASRSAAASRSSGRSSPSAATAPGTASPGTGRGRSWAPAPAPTGRRGAAGAACRRRPGRCSRRRSPWSLDVAAAGDELSLTLRGDQRRHDAVDLHRRSAHLPAGVRERHRDRGRAGGLVAQPNGGGEPAVWSTARSAWPGRWTWPWPGSHRGRSCCATPTWATCASAEPASTPGWCGTPGRRQAPGDVHTGGEREFVCVEPALLRPRHARPGRTLVRPRGAPGLSRRRAGHGSGRGRVVRGLEQAGQVREVARHVLGGALPSPPGRGSTSW